MGFATSIIYIVLKPDPPQQSNTYKFCYQHNLHSSQTVLIIITLLLGFATSIIYIVLKPVVVDTSISNSFATSIIYIVLKHLLTNLDVGSGFATSIIYIVLKQKVEYI